MPKFVSRWGFSLLACLFLLSSCSATYSTDFPPPDASQGVEVVFPEKLGDFSRQLQPMKVPNPLAGFEARYGDGKIVIDVIQVPTNAQADDYFKQTIVPNFDAMKNHSRAQVNGRWFASGTDSAGRIWYGWVNQNWVFVVNAVDQATFDLVPGNFKYLGK